MPLVTSHWPWLSVFAILTITVQVDRRLLQSCAGPGWLRTTQALHPLVAGLVTGLIWRHPEPMVTDVVSSCGYFMGAGALAILGYGPLKQWAALRGITVQIPGVDTTSPLPPPPKLPTIPKPPAV